MLSQRRSDKQLVWRARAHFSCLFPMSVLAVRLGRAPQRGSRYTLLGGAFRLRDRRNLAAHSSSCLGRSVLMVREPQRHLPLRHPSSWRELSTDTRSKRHCDARRTVKARASPVPVSLTIRIFRRIPCEYSISCSYRSRLACCPPPRPSRPSSRVWTWQLRRHEVSARSISKLE